MQGRALNCSVIAPSVIGGAMLPHAPQFFTMPETEDRDTVERVRGIAAEIGDRLKTLGTNDLAIVASALLRGAGFALSPADVLKLETDLGTLIRAITDCFEAVGLGHANGSPP